MLDLDTIRAFLDPHHLEIAEEASSWAEREIAPLPVPSDDPAARAQARQIASLLGQGGWLRHAHPLDLRACCLLREVLAAFSPLADEVFALQCLGSTPIALGGSDALCARYLARVVSGEAVAAFAMTEPEAGSDVASLRTRARRETEGFVLDGDKTLISNAGLADFYTVFARTDESAGHRGISCFVVDADTPGLSFSRPLLLSAPHPLGELRFDDCRIGADQLVGREGGGFKLGMATLDSLRATVAAAACGMASRALEEALRHATTRRQFGSPLSDFQLVQQKLAKSAIDLSASRLLVYRAAMQKDRGAERVTLESAMAKAFATEAAQRIIDDAVQVIGGRGVLADHPVDRLYRAIRPLRIYEGTTDIQHIVVARALIERHRAGRG